jgi:hypothetical protein
MYLIKNFRQIIIILLISFILINITLISINEEKITINNYELNHNCEFEKQFKMNCPSCGNTRSIISFFKGNFSDSWIALILEIKFLHPNIYYYLSISFALLFFSIYRYYFIIN